MTEPHDHDLILRIARGDEQAFRDLFRRYAPTATALARRVVHEPLLADEIVQEAFLAVWRNPDAYDERRGPLRSWRMRMVHRRAVDLVRRQGSQRGAAEAQKQDVSVRSAVDAMVQTLGIPGEREAVRAALAELPAEQRRAIDLMYFDALSQSEVARRLDLPPGAVRSSTLLGMRCLRAAFAEWNDGTGAGSG